MKPIISVENLGKRYRIGRREAGYTTFRESLTQAVKAPFSRIGRALGRARNGAADCEDQIWALKDVSFDVRPGEVVGIIGRNGAGKSTLLKVLSRITEPTEGSVSLWGRVASLLEVGTGFHTELTGRENIYLNASIIGMRKAEIDRRFEEIVAFAEVDAFLDTPVKRYSSGMQTRLAFAVAAHLEPEILIVDEVLAVGDADFQKKCLGKLESVGTQGRTVLFVSHSMPLILRLCNRVILLDRGHVIADGPSGDVTRTYLHSDQGSPASRSWTDVHTAPGDAVARLRSVRVLEARGQVADTIEIRQSFCVEVTYWHLDHKSRPTVALHFVNEDGIILFFTSDMNNIMWLNTPRMPGLVSATCTIPGNFLAEGHVYLLAAVVSYNPVITHVIQRDIVSFQVVDRSDGDGVRGPCQLPWPGVVRPMLDWNVDFSAP